MSNPPIRPQDPGLAQGPPGGAQEALWSEVYGGPEAQLPLADKDERLPWLEPDEKDDEGAFDLSRLVLVAIVGLVVVLALLAGLRWFAGGGPDEELLAEGSTITAPETPFRQRPEDPGLREVAGTGDISFAVGSGQSRESVLAADDAAAVDDALAMAGAGAGSGAGQGARPALPVAGAGAAAPSAVASSVAASSAAAPSAAAVGVQIAAFTSGARAEQGWRELAARFEVLQGRAHRVVAGSVDGATVHRLQVLADSPASAQALCASLRAAGGDCQVIR